jgi:hypothetical protein
MKDKYSLLFYFKKIKGRKDVNCGKIACRIERM